MNRMAKYMLACCFLVLLHKPSFGQQTQKKEESSASTIEDLLNYAQKHLHIPYRSGGASKRGFDCSGFVRYCFSNWGISLPHSSSAQVKHGEKIDLADAKPGDLIFFKGASTKSRHVGHVGIITDVKPDYVRFIHSAFKGGIRYDLLQATYYSRRFVGVRRIFGPEETGD